MLWRLHQQRHFAQPCPLNTWEGKASGNSRAGRKEQGPCSALVPTTGEGGISLAFRLSHRKSCSPERGRSLGGWRGEASAASCPCPSCAGQHKHSLRRASEGSWSKRQEGRALGAWPRARARTGPWERRRRQHPGPERPVCQLFPCFRDAISLISRMLCQGVTPSTDEETEAQEVQTGEVRRGGWI